MGSRPRSESDPTTAEHRAVHPAAAASNTPLARADHSRFVQRIRRRYAAELPLLAAGPPTRAAIDALIERLQADGRVLPAALRVARQLVL